jgi:hypothetical protein
MERRARRRDCSDAARPYRVAVVVVEVECLVEDALGEVTYRFRGSALDLSLGLGRAHRLVDEDAELPVLREEAARSPVAVLLEGQGLDRQVEDLTPDDHPNEAEQTGAIQSERVAVVLGSVLHVSQTKNDSRLRKRRFRSNFAGFCHSAANGSIGSRDFDARGRARGSADEPASFPILRARSASGFGDFYAPERCILASPRARG